MDGKTTICKSELLRRGWTEKTIKLLPPEPEEKQNPKYKNASPMLIWDKEKVEAMEQWGEFISAKLIKEKRKESQKAAIQTKEDKLLKEIEKCTVHVKKISEQELLKRTLQCKQNWYYEIGRYDYSADEADITTRQRWMVNYIRHNLTQYDSQCNLLFGRVGKQKAYKLLRDNILKAIAKAYPFLAYECDKQNGVFT